MLFTNLHHCAVIGGSSYRISSVPQPDRDQFLQLQDGLLTREIQVLNPTLVIFVTGPSYETYLTRELNDQRNVIEGFPYQPPARLLHNRLPKSSYRTYHPGFLKRNANQGLGLAPIQAILKAYLAGQLLG